MAKAILVLNKMPEKCDYCPLYKCDYGNDYEPTCNFNDKAMPSEFYNDRPDWCPLKELPEPEINNYITDDDWECLPDDYEVSTAYMIGHQNGWNDCLYAIENGEEE